MKNTKKIKNWIFTGDNTGYWFKLPIAPWAKVG
jgi:hypothetical protein